MFLVHYNIYDIIIINIKNISFYDDITTEIYIKNKICSSISNCQVMIKIMSFISVDQKDDIFFDFF